MDDAGRFIADALDRLGAAVADRDAPLRNLSLATVSAAGTPRLRTVILRALDRDPLQVTVFTDQRAGKIADITAHKPVEMLAWSAPDGLQLRLRGLAALHGAGCDVARRAWAGLSPGGRNAYGLDATPGSTIGAPDQPRPLPDRERKGFFAVITVGVDHLDVLRLGPHGAQTRAVRDGSGDRWVAP